MSHINKTTELGLFLWARCGGGHRTAKDALVQRLKKEGNANNCTLETEEVDITGHKILNTIWLPFIGRIGDYGVNAWDSAQKRGDITFLRRYASLNWLAEIILYPIVYFRTKWLLQSLKMEPKHVIGTQAFCISAIMHAMQTVNRQKKWNMHMHVYLTDLPSKKAIHFFPSIKHVGNNQKLSSIFTLHAPSPILKPNVTEDAFWKKHCGKHIKVITKDDFPIRQAFLDTETLTKKLEQKKLPISIKLNTPEEHTIIQSGKSKVTICDDEAKIELDEKDKLSFLMLGSQPSTQSVLDWLETYCEASKIQQTNHTNYLFLYCGAPSTANNPNPLLEAVHKKLQSMQLPEHVKIVPFTNQGADTIALLMARSDRTITRSGGATCMELLHLNDHLPKNPNKQILIHSEEPMPTGAEKEKVRKRIKKKDRYKNLNKDQLDRAVTERILRKKGIVLWESSNAKYLEEKLGARVVNPTSARWLLNFA